MSASIVLTGLAANDPVPGVYVETNFAQGPAAGGNTARPILVLANKIAAGSATADTTLYGPDTPVPLQTEADMIALAGAGSEAHRIYRRMASVNKDTAVYWVFVAPSAGTAASGTVVVANNATGNTTHQLYVGDEMIETSVASGDTPTTIAAAIAAGVNAKTHWPVSAAASTGTVTLTAKNAGPRGNEIRYMARFTVAAGSTTTATTDGALTGGATQDSNVNALSTILPRRFYYIVSAAGDATQAGALSSQVNTQAAPTTGIRQRCFFGSTDTLANVNTLATGLNSARAELVWSEKSPWTSAELAGYAAAIYALFEATENPRTNFASFGNDNITTNFWKVPRPRLDAAIPTRNSLKSALNNGVTPIGMNPNNTTFLVNRITTRSLSGAVPDYRIRAAHKVTICDFFADDLQAKAALQNAGKRIANDPPQGARMPGPQVVTPSVFRGQIVSLLNDYADNDLLQNLDQIKQGLLVQRETNPSTRMTARVPLQVVDNLEQIAVAVDQVA